MSYLLNPYIYAGISQGSILNLDAGNISSYSGSGTTWTDLSGAGNNATLINGVGYNSNNGGYLTFDNVNDYAATASSSSYAFGTGDFTFETWIYPENFSGYTHMIALPQQTTLALKADTGNGAIYLYTPTWDNYNPASGWTLSANAWNHVVFKRESSTGYGFLNSILKNTKVSFNNSFSAQVLNVHNGYPSEFVSSRISIVRVYNRALSNSEIEQNFNAVRSRYGL